MRREMGRFYYRRGKEGRGGDEREAKGKKERERICRTNVKLLAVYSFCNTWVVLLIVSAKQDIKKTV